MADVYATVQDVKDRWPDFPAGGDATAETLLGDASVMVRAECSTVADADPELLKLVVVDMVKSAMNTPVDFGGEVSSLSMTAGPMSQQLSYRNPAGDLYVTKKHKRLLGCGGQRAFEVDLLAGRDDDVP